MAQRLLSEASVTLLLNEINASIDESLSDVSSYGSEETAREAIGELYATRQELLNLQQRRSTRSKPTRRKAAPITAITADEVQQ